MKETYLCILYMRNTPYHMKYYNITATTKSIHHTQKKLRQIFQQKHRMIFKQYISRKKMYANRL